MSKIQYRSVADLKKLPNNPRTIKDKQFEILCDSINDNPEFFEARPILLSDRTGELIIIGGNQRYVAAKHLGLKEVPTFLFQGLDEEKEKELIIRDNVQNGDWDFDLLANDWSVEELNLWGVNIPNYSTDINLDNFFEDINEDKVDNKKKIILEYTDEEYELVKEELGKHGKTPEAAVFNLLGL